MTFPSLCPSGIWKSLYHTTMSSWPSKPSILGWCDGRPPERKALLPGRALEKKRVFHLLVP
jgi:hypothetical protein